MLQREDPVPSRCLPLKTRASRAGYFHTARLGMQAELDRGLRDHAGQPLGFKMKKLRQRV